MSENYIDPTDEAAMALFSSGRAGPVLMLNLLRFREVADYSANPELDPGEPISGKAAYQRYINHTLPFLEATGGQIVLIGDSDAFFVGPESERWDLTMIARQNSLQDFLSFATNAEYLAGVGHRTAAVSDSRLLPFWPVQGNNILGG